jgi:Na+-transporting methylmalonyl-CoA/oxaloacetate decarboxylase beta subunit
MIIAAMALIYLAIFKEIEPVLLYPLGSDVAREHPMASMTAAERHHGTAV